jgi:hypothetical protein
MADLRLSSESGVKLVFYFGFWKTRDESAVWKRGSFCTSEQRSRRYGEVGQDRR